MVRGDSDPTGQRKTIMTIRTTLLPIAGAALLLIGLTANAQAYQCLATPAVANGSALQQATALNRARINWSAHVQDVLTLQYSVYNIAEDKEESCSRVGRRYQCRVEANPCAMVIN